ncbi:hypothetical protein D3C81_1607660 [compost metagenome]
MTSETASNSRPRTFTSPVWLVTVTPPSLLVTETFFWVRSYTAADNRVLEPGGWYLMPSSHCLPSVGLKDSVADAAALLTGWNDSAYER